MVDIIKKYSSSKFLKYIRRHFSLIFYISANVFFKLIFGIAGIFLTRYLQPEEFGTLKTILAYTTMFSIVINFGISDYYYFLISKKFSAKNLQESLQLAKIYLSLYLLLYIPATVLYLLIYRGPVWLIGIAYLKILTDWLIDVVTKTLQAQNKFIDSGTIFILLSIAITIATLTPIITHSGILVYLLTLVILYSLVGTYSLIRQIIPKLKKILNKKHDFLKIKTVNMLNSIHLLKKTLPFLISSIATFVYTQIDILMLGAISKASVAEYAAATLIIFSLYIIPTSIYNFFLPKLVKTIHNATNYVVIKKIIMKFLFAILAFTLPFVLTFTIGAKTAIYIIYGNKYLQSARLLQILGIAMLFHTFSFVSGAILTALKKQNVRAIIQVGTGILNILLNLILIPKYLALGATYSTLFTEIILTLGYTSATIYLLTQYKKMITVNA